MILLLIKFEVVHLRKDNLVVVKANCKLLAHVEIPWIFEKVIFLPCDSLFIGFKLLDLPTSFQIDHCCLAASSERGATPIIF
jgi:hypothetical protein